VTEPSSDDLAAEARERTRRQVQDIFTRPRDVPERACPHCGVRTRTAYERCPVCGRSYFQRPARFSRRTRRLVQAAACLVLGAGAAVLVTVLAHQAGRNKAGTRQRQAAAVAAERRRLAREQRPHHALVAPRDRGDLPDVTRLARRRTLVGRLETAIAADARGRVARHELAARSIRGASCHPLVNGARADELELGKGLGRYSCEAAVGSATNGRVTSTLGLPFVGTIDFARGRLTWCKDNPVGAADVRQVLAFVRLARECTAARGPAFGSGYVIEPR